MLGPRANDSWGTPNSGGGGGGNNFPAIAAVGCAAVIVLFLAIAGAGGAVYFMSASSAAPPAPLGGPPAYVAPPIGGPSLPAYPAPLVSDAATGRMNHVRAMITSYSGPLPLYAGQSCALTIQELRREDGGIWCHTIVLCEGMPLYGDARTGFFQCTFAPGLVEGGDLETTAGDTDGAFSIRTMAQSVSLSDDSTGRAGYFALTATITRVE